MSEDAVSQLEQLVVDEREAIRQLDGARVLSYAERKLELVRALKGDEETVPAEHRERLRALAPALRHNSILLAHARDILRDALVATRIEVASGVLAQARPAATIPRILSVRG